MNLMLSLEHRFDCAPDGSIWTQTMFAYPFWRRYLDVFQFVRVVARLRAVADPTPGWQRADGPQVTFAPIPHYLGPLQYARRARAVRRAVQAAVQPADAVILRLPSPLAGLIEPHLRRAGHPYGVEVLGDPYDVFAPGAVRHPLRFFFRWWFPREMQRHIAGAAATAYVTESTIQRRYPARAGAFATHYSDVELPAGACLAEPRSPRTEGPYTLLLVGSLAQLYKGPDVLIDALAACVRADTDLRLVIVGDGKHRAELAARAAQLGLHQRVAFRGQLTAGATVWNELDQADLFVLPSRTEGLPRALIEAMARGLPCLGSNIGGIPELLSPDDLVPPGDPVALAHAIQAVVRDPQRRARMAARNLARSQQYREDMLRKRREQFYWYVYERTEAWHKVHPGYAPSIF